MKIIQMHDRMLGAVLRELTKAIEAEGIEFGEYGFSQPGHRDFKLPGEDWMCWQRVAVWPHVGSNEGWYIHIDLINWRGAEPATKIPGVAADMVPLFNKPSLNIGLAKTWSWASAVQIAEAAGRLLGAGGNGTFARFAFVTEAA